MRLEKANHEDNAFHHSVKVQKRRKRFSFTVGKEGKTCNNGREKQTFSMLKALKETRLNLGLPALPLSFTDRIDRIVGCVRSALLPKF